MSSAIDAAVLYVAVLAAAFMGAAYATARFAVKEWRATLAKIPVLRRNAIAAIWRAAVVIAATIVLVLTLAQV